MSSRSPRPRRRRPTPRPSRSPAREPQARSPRFFFSGREATIAAFIASLVAVAAVTALIVRGGGDGQSGSTVSAFDQQAIESLARRSVELLPQGEWPSLYDSFTAEFQQRCSRADFEQAGRDDAAKLGDDLFTIRFIRLEDLVVEGNTGRANIIGEVGGNTQYTIQASFQKIEDGTWRIAPAPGTQGCSAFNRLSTPSPLASSPVGEPPASG